MGRIRINVGSVIASGSIINSAYRNVSATRSSLYYTYRNIDNKIKSRNNINNRLSNVYNKLGTIESRIQRIQSVVERSANKYTTTDNGVISRGRNVKNRAAGISSSGGTSSVSKKKIFSVITGQEKLNSVGTAVKSGAFYSAVSSLKGKDGSIDSELKVFSYEEAEGKSSGSVLEAGVTAQGKSVGLDSSLGVDAALLSYKTDLKGSAEFDLEKKDVSASYTASASGSFAKASGKTSIGDLSTETKMSVGNASASGSVGASLFKEGKFIPSLTASAGVKASAATSEIEAKYGNDTNNVHLGTEGTLFGAEAKATAGAGFIKVPDKATGKEKTAFGIQGNASAEAYAAKGEVKGGINLLGIKVDVGVEGKAGGAGVEAGGSISTGGISGKVGLGLVLGTSVEVSIDWTEFDPLSIYKGVSSRKDALLSAAKRVYSSGYGRGGGNGGGSW